MWQNSNLIDEKWRKSLHLPANSGSDLFRMPISEHELEEQGATTLIWLKIVAVCRARYALWPLFRSDVVIFAIHIWEQFAMLISIIIYFRNWTTFASINLICLGMDRRNHFAINSSGGISLADNRARAFFCYSRFFQTFQLFYFVTR